MPKRKSDVDVGAKICDFIQEYQTKELRPPTIREIQQHCNFKSPRAVSYNLEKLEAKGLLTRRKNSRGIILSTFANRMPADDLFYTRSDWREDVADKRTILGYFDWVRHMRNAENSDEAQQIVEGRTE